MEENILKQKYNALLERYNNGAKYLVEHPENAEKTNAELNKIEAELSKIIEALPNMTDEERTEGFKLNTAENTAEAAEVVQNTAEAKSEQVESKQIVVKQDPAPTTTLSNFSDRWKIAEKLSKSSIIPKEFQGKPENILLCMGMSEKMGLDLITVVNNLQMVMGHQEWKGSFIPVLIEKTGKYTELEFNFVGKETDDTFGCYLEATRTRDGKRIKGTTITIAMAKQEGWYSRNSKWKTMPQQLLIYRASTFFARAYCAAALNGISTEGETNDINNRQPPVDIL